MSIGKCSRPESEVSQMWSSLECESGTDVAKSKMAREMLCFTIETAVVGRKGRICETAGAGYVRAMFALCSRRPRSSPHWNGGLEIA